MTFKPVLVRTRCNSCVRYVQGVKDSTLPRPRDMGKQTVFNRVVLRAISRVMGDTDRNLDPVDEALQVFFEDIVPGVVAPSAIAQQQNRLRVGVGVLAVPLPPQLQAVAGQFAGVMAEAERDVAEIPFEVIQAVRDHHARSTSQEIMVERLHHSRGVQRALAPKLPNTSFFFVSILRIGSSESK